MHLLDSKGQVCIDIFVNEVPVFPIGRDLAMGNVTVCCKEHEATTSNKDDQFFSMTYGFASHNNLSKIKFPLEFCFNTVHVAICVY